MTGSRITSTPPGDEAAQLRVVDEGSRWDGLALHADNLLVPPPFPQYANNVNFTWCLNDYNVEHRQLAGQEPVGLIRR